MACSLGRGQGLLALRLRLACAGLTYTNQKEAVAAAQATGPEAEAAEAARKEAAEAARKVEAAEWERAYRKAKLKEERKAVPNQNQVAAWRGLQAASAQLAAMEPSTSDPCLPVSPPSSAA